MDTVVLQFGDDETPAHAAAGDGVPSLEGVANLGLAFFDVARARGDHPAIVTEKATFTYGWLLRAAESVRRYLCSRADFVPGARVALKLANSPEYVAAYYGTLLADGVVVPLPVALEPTRLKQIEDACRPDILIVAKNFATETADTVTLPSCDASAPMPSPARIIGQVMISGPAPASSAPTNVTMPAKSSRNPIRMIRRGDVFGQILGTPSAVARSATDNGRSRTPVSTALRPSATERNSGTVKNRPACNRNWKKNAVSPPRS